MPNNLREVQKKDHPIQKPIHISAPSWGYGAYA
jgi:hypothetical protein